MNRFSVGQRVRVNRARNPHHGEETVIVAWVFSSANRIGEGSVKGWFYEVDIRPINPKSKRVLFRAHELIPIYDGDEAGSWDALADIWTPADARAVE